MPNGNFIPSELVVWAAGVKGPDVLKNLDGLEVSRSNTLVVKPTLQTTLEPDIFAFGDCAYLVPDGQTAPHSAARAGGASAGVISREGSAGARQRGSEYYKPFVYHDFGSLVSLGHYSTVGSLMGFVTGRKMLIEGFVAKVMYRSLYKMHEVALHGFWKVALDSVSRLAYAPHRAAREAALAFEGKRLDDHASGEAEARSRSRTSLLLVLFREGGRRQVFFRVHGMGVLELGVDVERRTFVGRKQGRDLLASCAVP